MASLPAFHSFDQASACNKQYGGRNASMVQSPPQLEAPDPSKAGESESGTLGDTAIQARQAIQVTKGTDHDAKKATLYDTSGQSSLQNNQGTRTAVDDVHNGDQASGTSTVPVLPLVDLDILKSTIFVTLRIARFLLQSATPPAVFAVILNLVFYPKSGEKSVLKAALFSALAVVATTLFFVASSVRTMLKRNKGKFNNKAHSDLSNVAAASYLFVLGSGGHTTEMISLIKLSQKPYIHTHRRYLMTVGDKHSVSQATMLEEDMANRYPSGAAGTSDLVTVTRARSVHQSYITSVFTSLKCFFEIVDALTTIPEVRCGTPDAQAFRSPHVIVTNGPGTGFIVGLVAFVLKLFHVVPRDRLKVVFVETWARTHSLGLTGKLFNLTQIADVFVVQSEGLAKAFNKPNIGNVNKKWAALVNPLSKEVHDAKRGAE
ncbi:UDP-N-acetylglucosamine transferase subunit [Gnomoniopsis sp. IMI 355080]|nr:UDP-N-acetylglucosamine transferase subunit [Gnomoniopsis sp. IMI 355080]